MEMVRPEIYKDIDNGVVVMARVEREVASKELHEVRRLLYNDTSSGMDHLHHRLLEVIVRVI